MKGCLEIIFVPIVAIIVASVLVWKGMPADPRPKTDSGAVFSEEANAEFEMMKRQFQTPEDYQKRLTGQQITEDEMKQRIATAVAEQQRLEKEVRQISNEEARAWYDVNKESMRIPPAFHAAHVFLTRHEKSKSDREREIRALHRRISSGQITFAAAAAQFSEDSRTKSLQGDLGWFTRDRMPAEFIAAVEGLKVGRLSEPVLTPLGWHIIRLIETRPSRLPTFEEAKAEITAALDLATRTAKLGHP